MVKISVIMPTYNSEKYIREAILSIITQTFTDYEFLIVDDNSRDKTREIALSFGDPRIKIINGPCRGLSAALNAGIDAAAGEYIARMDSDDIAMPERFLKQAAFLDANPEYGVCGTRATHFTDKRERGIYWARHVEHPGMIDQLLCSVVLHSAVMFRRVVFADFGLRYDESFLTNEDYELWSRAFRYTKFYNIQEPLMKYRRNPNGASQTKNGTGENNFFRVKRSILEFLLPSAIYKEENIDIQISMIVNAFLLNDTNGNAEQMIGLLNLPAQTSKIELEKENEKNAALKKELYRIKNTWSYRIGMGITFMPRKIRGGIKCVREHGVVYTMKLLLSNNN